MCLLRYARNVGALDEAIDAGGHTRPKKPTKRQRAGVKLIVWVAFGVIGGLVPLWTKGTTQAFHEALANGELYLIGEVVAIAALGEVFFSMFVAGLNISVFFLLLSIIFDITALIANLISGGHVPHINEAKITAGIYPDCTPQYWIYGLTVVAGVLSVWLGALNEK